MKNYFNNKGERVSISDMPSPHLLYALAKNKARMDTLMKRSGTPGFGVAEKYIHDLQDLIDSLRAEVKKRGLI